MKIRSLLFFGAALGAALAARADITRTVDAKAVQSPFAAILLTAARHTQDGAPISLGAGMEEEKPRKFFTVTNRDPGLPEAMRERLFKKFQRGDEAHAGDLGLGLSINCGFMMAQGGEVVAGENTGGGTVFTIYLPYAPHETAPSK
jgi:two-component system, OmpR family, sensor histidine kinase KdpD